ncbi:hypothetical protein Tco_1504818 [Tanacetum coccineum]
MNYYRSPPVQLAVLDLQKVPVIPAVLSPVPVKWSPVLVKWSPVPVVTASMSKSAQAASCRSDSYGQLPATMKSLPADPSLQSVMP